MYIVWLLRNVEGRGSGKREIYDLVFGGLRKCETMGLLEVIGNVKVEPITLFG